MARLVAVTQELAGLSHELNGDWTTIGRAEGNAFKIPAASVSNCHCEVRQQGGELLVRDLCSTNGTFVQGKKVTEAVLKAGQILRLGEVEVRFEAAAVGLSPATPFVNTKLVGAAAPKSPPANTAEQVNRLETGDAPPKRHQVLFADDSLAFNQTFSELCSLLANQTWAVHCATSADQALAILQQHPIDLAVLDIGIPMVDGIQLLGIIKRRHPGVRIAVLTGKATESNRAACLAGRADLFIEKPVSAEASKVVFNMLNDLVRWEQGDGFSGTLRRVGLPEVIQMECNGRRSAVLEVRHHEILGEIYIENGAMIHATIGTEVGVEALNQLLSLTGGEFRMKPFEPPAQRTLAQPWECLLLEAARCRDEETDFLRGRPPETPTKPVAPDPPPAAAENHAGPGDDFVVVATYDGQWSPVDVGNT
jgi:CheY-like chemotaxis protein